MGVLYYVSKLIWDKFSDKEKDEYRNFLKIFGALSGLFKDIKEKFQTAQNGYSQIDNPVDEEK